MFNLAYATDLEETYNKIKDIDTGGFSALSSELKTYIVSFADNMGSLFDSANSSWACSTKDSADNSVATIKASLESIKPSAELVGEVGPLVRNAIDNISEYIKAYQNYTQVKKSKPSETIRDVDAKGNPVRKANPAYATWKDVTLPNAYYNASNLENTSRASLNSITACLSGQKVSNATISPVSLGEGQFMVAIEEILSDGNVKRGYKVQDAEGNILKEIYNITNENNIVIQKSIVTYDREKNTRSEEYTLYYSNGDVVNGTKEYDQKLRVVSDIYTDTNGNKHTVTNQYVSDTEEFSSIEEKIESMMNGKKVITENNTPYYNGSAGDTEYIVYYEDKPNKPIQTGTIWYDKGDIKRDTYNLYDADGNSIGDGEKSYNSNGTLAQEEYHLYTEKRDGTITYSEDGTKIDHYTQKNSDDGSVDESTISYDPSGNAKQKEYEIKYKNGDIKSGTVSFREDGTEKDDYISYEKETNVTYDGVREYDSSGNLSSDDYTLRTSDGHEVKTIKTYEGNTVKTVSSQETAVGTTVTTESSITYGDGDNNNFLNKTVTETVTSNDNGEIVSVVTEKEGYNKDGKHFITNIDANGNSKTRVQNENGSYSYLSNDETNNYYREANNNGTLKIERQ